MYVRKWLTSADRFVPGAELFRSDRAFTVWAYSVSQGQLVIRTPTASRRTRIDILFKPVLAMKLSAEYKDGIVIRCADEAETERIRAENSVLEHDADARFLILANGRDRDYVVTHAVGWEEDVAGNGTLSQLAVIAVDRPAARRPSDEAPADDGN